MERQGWDRGRARRAGGALLLALVAAGCPRTEPVDPQAAARLQAERQTIEATIQRLETAQPERKGDLAPYRAQLAQARRTLSPSLLLHRLRDPAVDVGAMAYSFDHSEVKDLPALEALWQASAARMNAPPPLPASPLLRGVVQAEQNRAEKVYRATMLYGKAASPRAGLYYLGEAGAHWGFRDLAAAIVLPAGDDGPLDQDAVGAALERLEAESLEVFAAHPGGEMLIQVSALLKEARELFERGSLEGTALTLLNTRVAMSLLPGHAAPKTAGPALPRHMAEGTLAAPFLASALAETRPGSVTKLIRDEVYPLYRSFFRSPR
jgi:hypothetical protein